MQPLSPIDYVMIAGEIGERILEHSINEHQVTDADRWRSRIGTADLPKPFARPSSSMGKVSIFEKPRASDTGLAADALGLGCALLAHLYQSGTWRTRTAWLSSDSENHVGERRANWRRGVSPTGRKG